MAQSIEGVLIQILKAESGVSKSGKDWTKQEFIIETKEQYPKKICFSLFGDKTGLLSQFKEGMNVNVAYNIESREFNGKWFHNIGAWKIEKVVSNQTSDDQAQYKSALLPPSEMADTNRNEPEPDDLPF